MGQRTIALITTRTTVAIVLFELLVPVLFSHQKFENDAFNINILQEEI